MRAGPERVVLRKGNGLNLICLPFAGGSARSFARLTTYVGEDWNVTAVQPPAGFAAGECGLDALSHFYLGLLAEDLRGPGIVLGHSLGAAVAHRMAQLRSATWPGNLHVVLSAPPAPGIASGELLRLDDRALLAEATRSGMLPDLGISEDFALRFLLPGLRNDLAVLGTRGWQPDPVSAPVHLLGGTEDTTCPAATLELLREALTPMSCRQVEGGHMYVLEQPDLAAGALLDIADGINTVPAAVAAIQLCNCATSLA
ncbi:thioesterase II family protein [Streptomyces sp. NPDC002586]